MRAFRYATTAHRCRVPKGTLTTADAFIPATPHGWLLDLWSLRHFEEPLSDAYGIACLQLPEVQLEKLELASLE